METKVYSVGEMAKLCNISSRLLRHYDKKNLIVPAIRDSKNNYRFYTQYQIEEILLLKEMRQIGMPLERISSLLADRNLAKLNVELDVWLTSAKAELEQAQKKYNKTIELMFRLLNAKNYMHTKTSDRLSMVNSIEIVNIPKRDIVSTRREGLHSIWFSFIDRRAELYGFIEQYGLEINGPNMSIFHQDYMSQFGKKHEECQNDVEVFAVLAKESASCGYCRVQEAFSAVTCMHIGSYRSAKSTYQKLEAWAKENHLSLSGDSVEEYIIGATQTNNEENYLTRILLPLKGHTV